jgi:hypothetical protein
MSSNVSLEWILNEAEHAQLYFEAHIKNNLLSSTHAKIHKSRHHVYRIKKPLHRVLIVADKPSKIHTSVKERYVAVDRFCPPKLKKLVHQLGWDKIEIGL